MSRGDRRELIFLDEKGRQQFLFTLGRLVREALRKIGWTENDLKQRRKGDGKKVGIARQLREHTPMSRQWIATRLHMGSASYLSALLESVDSEL
jgi:hypothetical protein